MATKPSPWADEPFHLIAIPSLGIEDTHSYMKVASDMALAHNVLIRGLNSIIQQAPFVPSADQKGYRQQDVKDLFSYIQAWVKMVHHHHWVEESFWFPAMEKLSKPGIMDGPKHQHELFQPGLDRLSEYVLLPEYRWSELKDIIDSFSGYLTDHLYAEIDIILGLKDLDSEGLLRTWTEAEVAAKQSGNLKMLYDVFPCVLGNADKTSKGGESFPPLPWIMPYLIKYWFAAGNGAWRFNPCDWWGQPRQLEFVRT